MLKKPLFLEAVILFLLAGALHLVATIYHLYWSIYEFDSIVHFFAGAALAIFFLWFYFFSEYFDPKKRSLKKFLIITFFGSMFVALSWEIYEIVFKQTFVQKNDYAYDTTMDIIMDILGILAGCFYGFMKELEIKKTEEININNEQT